MVHDCTDSLALLNHVNSRLEQTCRDNTAHCLDNQYHALRKNVPSESEFLFGDNLLKRIMNITTNKKLFSMPLKLHNTSFKTSKNLCRFPQIPGNQKESEWVPKESLWSIPETLQQQSKQQLQAPKSKEKVHLDLTTM